MTLLSVTREDIVRVKGAVSRMAAPHPLVELLLGGLEGFVELSKAVAEVYPWPALFRMLPGLIGHV